MLKEKKVRPTIVDYPNVMEFISEYTEGVTNQFVLDLFHLVELDNEFMSPINGVIKLIQLNPFPIEDNDDWKIIPYYSLDLRQYLSRFKTLGNGIGLVCELKLFNSNLIDKDRLSKYDLDDLTLTYEIIKDNKIIFTNLSNRKYRNSIF